MFDKQSSIKKIRQYYRQVSALICNEAVFSFGHKKIVKRSKINDVLCCAKSNFPEEYWAYVEASKKSAHDIPPKSYELFLYFEFLVTQKFFIFADYCIIDTLQTDQCIRELLKALEINFLLIQQTNQEKQW